MVKLIDIARSFYDNGQETQAMLITQILRESLVLQALDFRNVGGSKSETTILTKYSPATTRGINQGVAVSSSQTTTYEWPKSIISARSLVDEALIDRNGINYVEFDRIEKMRSLKSKFETMLIKGDRSSDPTEFDGLQKTIGTNLKQSVAAGSSSGGDALDLGVLDKIYRLTKDPTHWIMNLDMATRFDKAARNSTSINITNNELFGFEQITYKGLPIAVLKEDTMGNEILPFTEENPGGGTPASTSIYCVSINPMGLSGIQTRDMRIRVEGDPATEMAAHGTDSEGKEFPAYKASINWDVGIEMIDLRCATRAYGIKNAPIVDN